MKIIICTTVGMLISVSFPCQNPIFTGGGGDGWSVNGYLQSESNIFKGGSADGWTFASYQQLESNIFGGGVNDGWASNYTSAQLEVNCIVPTSPIITGNTELCYGQSAIFTVSAGNTDDTTNYIWTGPNNFIAEGISIGSISTAGTYTCVISNSDTCSVSVNIVLVVHPLPPAPVVMQNGNILQSSASSGNQWYLNGNPISGETGDSYIPTESGNYHVVVTDENGCENVSEQFIITEIENLKVNSFVSVYPNPFNSTLYIRNLSGGNPQVILINPLGQTIMQIQIESQTTQLDLSELSNGMYFLRVDSVSGRQLFKVQKQ